MNSTMRPIFNIFQYVNSVMNSNKQCMNSDFCLCTMNPCEVTVHVQEKKEEGGNTDVRKRWIQLKANGHCMFNFPPTHFVLGMHIYVHSFSQSLHLPFTIASMFKDSKFQVPMPILSPRLASFPTFFHQGACGHSSLYLVSMQCIAYNKLLPTFTAFEDRCSTLLVGDTPMCIYSKSIYNKMTTFQYNR